MPSKICIGTSGYASPSVRGRVPSATAAASDMLRGYGTRFDAVEMDSAFYRPPSPATIAGWSDCTSEDFTFTIRMPRQITHVDRLRMPARVSRFVASLRTLGPRLGCLLFTTPPTLDCELERLEQILEAVGDVPTAWEFRHSSWLTDDVLRLIVDHGSTVVVVETFEDLNGKEFLPGGAFAERFRPPFCYLRFRKDRYRPGDLIAWGEVLSGVLAEGFPVYGFFRQSDESIAYATALSELLVEMQRGDTPVSIRLS